MFYGSNAKIVFKTIFEFDEVRKNYSLEDFVSVKLSESVTKFFIDQKIENPTFEAFLYLSSKQWSTSSKKPFKSSLLPRIRVCVGG